MYAKDRVKSRIQKKYAGLKKRKKCLRARRLDFWYATKCSKQKYAVDYQLSTASKMCITFIYNKYTQKIVVV